MKYFLRFALLSGGGWLLDCTLLLLFVHGQVGLGISNFLSSISAALAVFVLSRWVVFQTVEKAVDKSALPSAVYYLIYQLFNIFLVSMVIAPVVGCVREVMEGFGLFFDITWNAFLGKVILTPPQLVCNFLVSRFLVLYWRRPSPHV